MKQAPDPRSRVCSYNETIGIDLAGDRPALTSKKTGSYVDPQASVADRERATVVQTQSSLHGELQFFHVVVEFARGAVRDAMLNEIAAWALDQEFADLVEELSGLAGISPTQATAILYPEVRRIWEAAKGTAGG